MNDVTERFIATYKNMGLTGCKISEESKIKKMASLLSMDIMMKQHIYINNIFTN